MGPILLADMNSFFASVTQALEPELRNREVLIAGSRENRHGIILAASYPAKKKGVKTGMAIWEALLCAPQAILRPPDFPSYLDYSSRMISILRDFSPLVEPFSIDEAFIDLSGTEHILGSPRQIALQIKKRISEELHITCSIGIGPSKVVAKMAAELEKPDGLNILTAEDVSIRLWPLPIKELYGVGRQMEKHLRGMGFRTIGDLAQSPPSLLQSRFGLIGLQLYQFANGRDSSSVDPNSLDSVKSMGHQLTLPKDYSELKDISLVLLELAEAVCRRLRLGFYTGRTISLFVRGADFSSLHRSKSIRLATDLPWTVHKQALGLFKEHWPEGKPVRLLGVSVGNLNISSSRQLCLFDNQEKLCHTYDEIKNRFGETSLLRGSFLLETAVFYSDRRCHNMGRPPRSDL